MKILRVITGVVTLCFTSLCVAHLCVAKDAAPKTPAPEVSAAKPAMTDIFDIKPLERFGVDPDLFKWSVAFALIVLSILILLFFLMRRRKKESLPQVATPPDQKALARLSALEKELDMDGKIFYFTLSEILREYISGRFAIAALEMTTEELVDAMAGLAVNEDLKNKIIGLSRGADPVKFAGKPPVLERMRQDLLTAREVVKRTAPDLSIKPAGTDSNKDKNQALS